jgi:hypothetical protein
MRQGGRRKKIDRSKGETFSSVLLVDFSCSPVFVSPALLLVSPALLLVSPALLFVSPELL